MRTRNSLRYFKIFIKDTGRPSISILEYIAENIDIINEMGVKIKIAKLTSSDLDKEMVDKLAAKGILRFPALVTDENKVKLGVEKIKSLFAGNIQSYNHFLVSQRPGVGKGSYVKEVDGSPELAALYHQEMSLEAIERDRSIGESEGFEGGASEEFNRRVGEQLNSRKINSGGSTNSFDMSNLMARRQGNAAPSSSRKKENPRRIVPKESENIATDRIDEAPRTPKPAPARTSGGTGTSFDDSMFDRAFTEGLGEGYY